MNSKPVFVCLTADSNYLEHYGVLGMKWGVRNAETLARYGRERKQVRAKKRYEKDRKKALTSRSPKTLYKKAYTLSNDELAKRTHRLELEGRVLDVEANNKKRKYNVQASRANARKAKFEAFSASILGKAVNAVTKDTVKEGKKAVASLLRKKVLGI